MQTEIKNQDKDFRNVFKAVFKKCRLQVKDNRRESREHERPRKNLKKQNKTQHPQLPRSEIHGHINIWEDSKTDLGEISAILKT